MQQKLTFNVGCGCLLTCLVCVWAEEDPGPQKAMKTRSCAARGPGRADRSKSDAGGHGRGLLTAEVVAPLLLILMKSSMKLQNQEKADFHCISCRNGRRIRLGVQTRF